MFDSASRSDQPHGPSGVPPGVRGDSVVQVRFACGGGRTHMANLFERGSFRLRYPRANGAREAVLVNAGGGITGGDRLKVGLEVGSHATAVVTSQAAEKLYRSDGPAAQLSLDAVLEPHARLDWLPQESILFDRASVQRTLDVAMDETAHLTVLECLFLGRTAHGERLRQARWQDRWRIRRQGRLVFADEIRMDGALADLLSRPAIGAGAQAIATILHVSPEAETRLAAVRAVLAGSVVTCGASAWNGILVVRLAGADARATRNLASQVACAVTGRPMPRSWAC